MCIKKSQSNLCMPLPVKQLSPPWDGTDLRGRGGAPSLSSSGIGLVLFYTFGCLFYYT